MPDQKTLLTYKPFQFDLTTGFRGDNMQYQNGIREKKAKYFCLMDTQFSLTDCLESMSVGNLVTTCRLQQTLLSLQAQSGDSQQEHFQKRNLICRQNNFDLGKKYHFRCFIMLLAIWYRKIFHLHGNVQHGICPKVAAYWQLHKMSCDVCNTTEMNFEISTFNLQLDSRRNQESPQVRLSMFASSSFYSYILCMGFRNW